MAALCAWMWMILFALLGSISEFGGAKLCKSLVNKVSCIRFPNHFDIPANS